MMQRYEYYPVEQTITRLALAVRLRDDYTPIGGPIGKVNVSLSDQKIEAIKNPTGYYLFLDLPSDTYRVVVETDYYFDEDVNVTTATLDPTSPIVNITLKPDSTYPFPAGSTLIRAVVRESGGSAIQGSKVKATVILPEAAIKARVSQGGAGSGDSSVRLVNIVGAVNVGDVLMIKDSNRSRIEFCRIAAPGPSDPTVDPFNLVNPLTFAHPSGTPLHLMVVDSTLDTRTTEKGELVIYFGLVKASKFLTRLEVSHPSYQTVEREVEVSEGSQISLGIIELTPV